MPQLLAAYLPAIIGAAVSTAGSMVVGHQQEVSAHKEARESRAAWAKMSKPSAEAVEASEAQYRGGLGQARAGAYRSLASELAARGFGPGSGEFGRRAVGIERGYLEGLGKMGTELTKFKTTPMFGPPSQAYPGGVSGAPEAGVGKATSMLDKALGYYTMMNLLKGQQGQGTYPGYNPYQNQWWGFQT